MEARPESSRQLIVKVLEELTPVVADEISRVLPSGEFEDPGSVWKKVSDSVSIERLAKYLVENGTDRMHVIYVYSRFRNSPAVGPPLVKWAINKHLKERKVD